MKEIVSSEVSETMTQTMRDKLQSLADLTEHVAQNMKNMGETVAWDVLSETRTRMLSILATEPSAVTVRAGWVAKCGFGLTWFPEKPYWDRGTWICSGRIAFLDGVVEHIITDPWPDHSNGGPECLLEVK